jgi:hypothetical protein
MWIKTDVLVNNLLCGMLVKRYLIPRNSNVTKLAGTPYEQATIINSLFSSDALKHVTFIAGEIKEPKRIFHVVYSWYFDCYYYLCVGKRSLFSYLPMQTAFIVMFCK